MAAAATTEHSAKTGTDIPRSLLDSTTTKLTSKLLNTEHFETNDIRESTDRAKTSENLLSMRTLENKNQNSTIYLSTTKQTTVFEEFSSDVTNNGENNKFLTTYETNINQTKDNTGYVEKYEQSVSKSIEGVGTTMDSEITNIPFSNTPYTDDTASRNIYISNSTEIVEMTKNLGVTNDVTKLENKQTDTLRVMSTENPQTDDPALQSSTKYFYSESIDELISEKPSTQIDSIDFQFKSTNLMTDHSYQTEPTRSRSTNFEYKTDDTVPFSHFSSSSKETNVLQTTLTIQKTESSEPGIIESSLSSNQTQYTSSTKLEHSIEATGSTSLALSSESPDNSTGLPETSTGGNIQDDSTTKTSSTLETIYTFTDRIKTGSFITKLKDYNTDTSSINSRTHTGNTFTVSKYISSSHLGNMNETFNYFSTTWNENINHTQVTETDVTKSKSNGSGFSLTIPFATITTQPIKRQKQCNFNIILRGHSEETVVLRVIGMKNTLSFQKVYELITDVLDTQSIEHQNSNINISISGLNSTGPIVVLFTNFTSKVDKGTLNNIGEKLCKNKAIAQRQSMEASGDSGGIIGGIIGLLYLSVLFIIAFLLIRRKYKERNKIDNNSTSREVSNADDTDIISRRINIRNNTKHSFAATGAIEIVTTTPTPVKDDSQQLFSVV